MFDDPPPFQTDALVVPGGHVLRLTQHGAPQGVPVLLLHGGPGSGCSPLLRRFFNPDHWRMVCVDQRGAGASRPAGGVQHNTTAHLLADLRQVRQHLHIPRWWVVGGSWGATLAVAHAADAPDAVAGLLLRASFLARAADVAGFFQRSTTNSPAATVAWDAQAALLPQASGQPLLPSIARVMTVQPAGAAQYQLAAAWWAWEQALSGGTSAGTAPDTTPGPAPTGPALDAQVARYRVQSHYLQHGCWLQSPSLLGLAARVPRVPTLLLHGTADHICPPDGAQALQQALPHSRLQWVAGAGHDPTHPAMTAAMLAALRQAASTGGFAGAQDRTPAAPAATP